MIPENVQQPDTPEGRPHRKYLGLEDVPPPPKRRCEGCGCFLRTGNTGRYCSVCQDKSFKSTNLEIRTKRQQEGGGHACGT